MCSAEPLREFIRERLTAAAEEIFTQLGKTIVQYEEEIHRQRRLLELSWRPGTVQGRGGQHVCNEKEVQMGQQPSDEDANCGFDQGNPEAQRTEQNKSEGLGMKVKLEEPELLQLKEEDGEIWISQGEEQLVLNQQTDTLMMKDGEHGEPEPNRNQNSLLAESLNQKGSSDEEPGSSPDEALKQKKRDVTKLKRHRADKRRLCKICGKSFNPCYFYDHVRTHTGEKRFSCKICGKGFIQRYQCTVHMRTHTGERPFSCQTCGKSFIQKSNLITHMRIHSRETPHPCEICGKDFSRSDLLASHMSTHAPKTSISCQTCGKSFSKKIYLTRHLQTHTGEKPFKCQICGKGFVQKDNLITHTRTHTGEKPYSCETCGKSFSDRSNVKHHMRTHTGERPFSCHVCGKCFIQKNNLVSHMKVHTGEKLFPCEICALSFSRSANLTRHMASHTDELPLTCLPSEPGFIDVTHVNSI